MRQSKLFAKTRREAPKGEVSKNAQLLIRAGFIHKEIAGVYDYLPLGLRVIEKIKQIIREEMDYVGASEFLMSTLQRREVWEKTNRWDDKQVNIWFKSKLANGSEIGLGWSHEEPITDMMTTVVTGYRDLPIYVYQFQNKLRNELRAKSGIMRGREFLMKDLYSYSLTEEAHQAFYKTVTEAYHRVFARLGIGDTTYLTFSSGGAFTQFSHEFQTLCDAGEDIIYLDREKKLAVNEDVLTDDVIAQLGLDRKKLEKVSAAEVGNIFSFGTTKSEQLGLRYTDKDGNMKYVVLGSYGIGVTRVMGVIAELMSDERGLIWPDAIAPYRVHLLVLGDDRDAMREAESAYSAFVENDIEVLFDDRSDASAGEKFATSDLFGIPWRVVVSSKSLKSGGLELKRREGDAAEVLALADVKRKIIEKI